MEAKERADLMTVPELASYLGVGRTVAYRLAREELPSFRLGRKLVRVRRADVDRWLDERATVAR